MRYIIKNAEPHELSKYRETPGVCFDEMDSQTKAAVKSSLLKEQGYLCCYCGKQIELDIHTILEHLLPRGVPQYRSLELYYENILASCDGGQRERASGNKRFPEYCDSKKKNYIIPITPLDPTCECSFIYDEVGEIHPAVATNNDAIRTIDILGLNNPYLNHCRKAVIDAYKDWNLSRDQWMNELEKLNKMTDRLIEFCFVARYYIQNYKI